MRYYKRFYSISHVTKLCPNVIVFGFIVVMLFKTMLCFNYLDLNVIALYLLIININIYTIFYVFFVLLIIAWVRYQRRMVEIQVKKYNGVVLWMVLQWMLFLHQVIIGDRVNGTFTSKTYDDIVKELVEKFHMENNKDKVKN